VLRDVLAEQGLYDWQQSRAPARYWKRRWLHQPQHALGPNRVRQLGTQPLLCELGLDA